MGNFQNLLEQYTVTIANSGSLSGSVYLGGNGLVGIANPGTWTAAPLTFRVSLGSVDPGNGGTWVNYYGGFGEYTVNLPSGTGYQAITPSDFPSVYWLQLRSGVAAGGTVQSQAVNLTLFTRPVL